MGLREMFTGFRIRDRVPQLEVAVGEDVIVFVLRHLEPLPDEDAAKMRAFADRHGIQWWLQPKGPDSAHPFYPLDNRWYYGDAISIIEPWFWVMLGTAAVANTQQRIGRILEFLPDPFCQSNFTWPPR